MFLSGKVMLDDGTAPLETVVIERVCGASHRPEAYTDTKGRFSFQMGQSQQMFADASVDSTDTSRLGGGNSGGRTQGSASGAPLGSDPRLMGCELRASLAGYRSDAVNLGDRHVLDNPDVGTIILHRLGNVEGTTISATSLDAPKDAKKAYEKGLDSVKKQDWSGAQKQLEKAVNAYPRYAAAWYQLGTVEEHQNNAVEARKAFVQAIQADPKYLRPYLPIAALAVREKNWQDVADTTDRLVRLDPVDFPQALLYNAIANVNLNHFDVAEKSAREAIRIDTDHQFPRAEYVLGFILRNRQDYAAALPLMKSYVAREPNAPDIETIKKQIVQMEQVAAAGQPAAKQE
jgi:tetratricopeptide (TPR) repeat protein